MLFFLTTNKIPGLFPDLPSSLTDIRGQWDLGRV